MNISVLSKHSNWEREIFAKIAKKEIII